MGGVVFLEGHDGVGVRGVKAMDGTDRSFCESDMALAGRPGERSELESLKEKLGGAMVVVSDTSQR